MSIIKYTVEEFAAQLGSETPVPVPIGNPVSTVRVKSILAKDGTTRTGLWECSPGRWRRQILHAEYSCFLAGDCTFTPDQGDPVEIRSGDVVYFPANTTGIWDIRTHTRKVYIVFG